MIDDKVRDAFSKQINAELYSAYLYLSMSAYFESESLPGAAAWMRAQAQEETEHAMKFYRHIVDRGGRVMLDAIDAPPAEFDSLLAVFEASLEHERKVTKMIDCLVDLARKVNDHAAEVFLQWFVTEQVEEEASVEQIVDRIKQVQDAPAMRLMIDRELAQRGEDD